MQASTTARRSCGRWGVDEPRLDGHDLHTRTHEPVSKPLRKDAYRDQGQQCDDAERVGGQGFKRCVNGSASSFARHRVWPSGIGPMTRSES